MQIEGLTNRQVELCDALWDCETMDEVETMLYTLTPSERMQAETLMQIMVMNEQDEQLELMDRYPDAEAMIERLKKDYL